MAGTANKLDPSHFLPVTRLRLLSSIHPLSLRYASSSLATILIDNRLPSRLATPLLHGIYFTTAAITTFVPPSAEYLYLLPISLASSQPRDLASPLTSSPFLSCLNPVNPIAHLLLIQSPRSTVVSTHTHTRTIHSASRQYINLQNLVRPLPLFFFSKRLAISRRLSLWRISNFLPCYTLPAYFTHTLVSDACEIVKTGNVGC